MDGVGLMDHCSRLQVDQIQRLDPSYPESPITHRALIALPASGGSNTLYYGADSLISLVSSLPTPSTLTQPPTVDSRHAQRPDFRLKMAADKHGS